MTHDEASELLAVFALDAVDLDERQRIEQHVDGCPRCRAELDAHREVAAALGNSVDPLPEGLWSRLASRLPERPDEEPPPMPALVRPAAAVAAGRESAARFSSAGPIAVPSARSPRGTRGRLVALGSFAAAAAVVAVVLGLNLVHDNRQISRLHAALGPGAPSVVTAALETPGHTVVNVTDPARQRVAQFVVVPDGRGYLVSSALPRLTSGETYQLWGVVGGHTISLGLMGQAPEHVTFTLAGTERPTRLAITAEPAGGSVTPTPPMVATGTV
jgi:anti-sigma-K factor RskA